MRIGIYTQPLNFNYGGILQAWALQTILKRMGHDVVTFNPDQYRHLSLLRMPFAFTIRIIRKLTGKPGITDIRFEAKYNRTRDTKMKYLKPFLDEMMNIKTFRDTKEISQCDYDILITGSDQVWRPKYNVYYGRSIENAFLDFAKNWHIKRIAYAASFGTDEWEFTEEQTIKCSELAKKFDTISVREKSAIKLCKEHLGVDAVNVLDPTLLLNHDDYEQLIVNGQQTTQPSGNLLCYVLDRSEEKDRLIYKIANNKGLTPFRAHSRVFEKNANIEEMIQPSVEQWLRNFRDCQFVVTDSFHACVFSIIFRKPFVVIANKHRGIARYKSLFSLLSIENHLLYSEQDYDENNSYVINDFCVNRLNTLKEISIGYLIKALQ